MRTLMMGGALALAATSAAAQPYTESIAFDRPEAWALEYFVAVSTFTTLGPPVLREPGEAELALELGWVPSLSEAERRVGFAGTKVEDLNKTSFIGRPRAAFGLPGRLTLELGWVPPIERNGAKANLVSVALERPFLAAGALTLGWRLYGLKGTVEGDITCPEEVVAYPPGSAGNPYGCLAASDDSATLDHAGGALTGGIRLNGGATFHFAAGATYSDAAFQVRASLDGFEDRTRLETAGWTGWVAAGVGAAASKSTWFGLEAFYSPLDVVRPPSTDSQNDALFNVRAIVRMRVN